MSDTPPPTAEWLTYQQAGERLGLRPEAVAARARRGRWPRRIRNDANKTAEALVPGELLAQGPQKPKRRESPTSPPTDGPAVAEAVQAAVAPLQATVDVLLVDLKVARASADALRVEVATAQAEAAELRGAAAANTARIEDLKAAAERADRDRQGLERQVNEVRDKLSTAQAEAGKASSQARDDRRKLEEAEDRLAKLRRELLDEQAKPKRRRWLPW